LQEVEKWLEEAENTEAPDFEDTVAEYIESFKLKGWIQALEERTETVGESSWSPEAHESNMLEVLKVTDSEVEVGMDFEAEDYRFTIWWRLK
jgi:hypothetical protein